MNKQLKKERNSLLRMVSIFTFVVLAIIAIIILIPIVFVWFINTLLNLKIAITYMTWFASAFLIILVSITLNGLTDLFPNITAKEILAMNREQRKHVLLLGLLRIVVFISFPIIFMYSLNALFGLNISINHKILLTSTSLMLLIYLIFNGIDEVFRIGSDVMENNIGKEDEMLDFAKLFIIVRNGPQPDDVEAYKKYIMGKFSLMTELYIGKETQIHFMPTDREIKESDITKISKTLLREKKIPLRFLEHLMYEEEKDDVGYKVTLILVGVSENDG
ncbi:membrane protein [Candidatus Magnetobacterium bavaricum]|uniref:Membrane protein n=1 Tax=Candidatus Magnetobacterium bavaricum TaxID=29290 RepID=A0A0F3GVH7_9BACT|nr:membrane protein [Candidatus Magnetobacterium bavaricum]